MSLDDRLLEQLVSMPNDPDLWAELYDRLVPRLRLFTFSILRQQGGASSDEADDIVHDVLMEFVRHFDRLQREIGTFRHLQNYLLKACRNRVNKTSRRAQVRQTARELVALRFYDVAPDAVTKNLEHEENRKLIRELSGALNPDCRSLMNAYLLDQWTLAEIAAKEGTKLGTIYSRWQRCLKEMRKILG
jgi:RNA polymerase sigma factor (sigma-70 family)